MFGTGRRRLFLRSEKTWLQRELYLCKQMVGDVFLLASFKHWSVYKYNNDSGWRQIRNGFKYPKNFSKKIYITFWINYDKKKPNWYIRRHKQYVTAYTFVSCQDIFLIMIHGWVLGVLSAFFNSMQPPVESEVKPTWFFP